jgi:hypothetical protein
MANCIQFDRNQKQVVVKITGNYFVNYSAELTKHAPNPPFRYAPQVPATKLQQLHRSGQQLQRFHADFMNDAINHLACALDHVDAIREISL